MCIGLRAALCGQGSRLLWREYPTQRKDAPVRVDVGFTCLRSDGCGRRFFRLLYQQTDRAETVDLRCGARGCVPGLRTGKRHFFNREHAMSASLICISTLRRERHRQSAAYVLQCLSGCLKRGDSGIVVRGEIWMSGWSDCRDEVDRAKLGSRLGVKALQCRVDSALHCRIFASRAL